MRFYDEFRMDIRLGQHEGMSTLAAFFSAVYWTSWFYLAPMVCAVQGHQWVDFDWGCPETGPMPDVRCDRCGRES